MATPPGATCVVNVAVLLAGLGSGVTMEFTVAVLETLPPAVAWTGMVTVATSPGVMVPMLHVTVLLATVHVPRLVVTGDWQLPRLQ